MFDKMQQFLGKVWKHRQLLFRRYIWRSSPYAIYSWRYILPSKNRPLCCQRYFAFRVLPELPRAAAVLVVLHQLIWWYLFHGPRAVLRHWFARSAQLAGSNGVSRLNQLLFLIRMTYSRTIHPVAYYQLSLHHCTYAETFYYIYSQQLPDWHTVWQQPALASDVQFVVRDKVEFAKQMSVVGMLTVPTLAIWQRNTAFKTLPVFKEHRVFCKPIAASRAEGCFSLSSSSDAGLVTTFAGDTFRNDAALAFLNQCMINQSYVVQPLLIHHSALDQFLSEPANKHSTITVRLVSAIKEGQVLFMAANLEVNAQEQRAIILPIEPESGLLIEQGFVLPLWQQLLQQAKIGHRFLGSARTLGWDFVICQDQVVCLEVNLNWGVNPVQQPLQGGLLSKYSDVYL